MYRQWILFFKLNFQGVLASRRELLTYDVKRFQSGDLATPHTPLPGTILFSMASPLSVAPQSDTNCFGCASATLEHCITILKALAFKQKTRTLLVQEVDELLGNDIEFSFVERCY